MSRVSIRLDPGFADRKRHYPDGPYRALVDCLCAAEYEPIRGQFRSMAILRAVIGRSARHLPYLFGSHDLQLTPEGQIDVVGWQEWQEGDLAPYERAKAVKIARARRHGMEPEPETRSPGAVRVARHRERQRALHDEAGNALLDAPSNAVTTQDGLAVSGLAVSGKRVGDALPRPTSEAAKVKAWLRDHDISQPVGWETSKVNELAKRFTAAVVIATFEEARSLNAAVTCRNYVRWAEQSLSPDQSPNGQKPRGHHGNSAEIADAFRS